MLSKWEMTDLYSPYLITNYVSNRTRMVYKKIKIALKQRDEPIPSGPTGDESEIRLNGLMITSDVANTQFTKLFIC